VIPRGGRARGGEPGSRSPAFRSMMAAGVIHDDPRFTREQPPELVRAITQAIDRIAPAQGAAGDLLDLVYRRPG